MVNKTIANNPPFKTFLSVLMVSPCDLTLVSKRTISILAVSRAFLKFGIIESLY